MDMMHRYTQRALDIAQQIGDAGQIALAQRHLGYYHVLRGAYTVGESLLEEARVQFEALGNQPKYRLHIAAAIFFYGESKCRQGMFFQVLQFYRQALELCDVEANLATIDAVYLRFGYIHYHLGDLDLAMDYLTQSIKAYEGIIFIWGRADAYYYLHKVCKEKKLFAQSSRYLSISKQILSAHNFRLSL